MGRVIDNIKERLLKIEKKQDEQELVVRELDTLLIGFVGPEETEASGKADSGVLSKIKDLLKHREFRE